MFAFRRRSPAIQAAFDAFLDAERRYDQASYARVLGMLEALPQDDCEVLFMRAGVAHALAELRGDASLMLVAMAGYERAGEVLPRRMRRMTRDLVQECRDQLAEAGLG